MIAWVIAPGAALVPTCSALVLVLSRRRDGVILARVGAFIWGAVAAASFSAVATDALGRWVTEVASEAQTRTLMPMLGGPLVEELAKAAGLVAILVLQPGAIDGLVDGIVCGALVGLGFTIPENVGYLTLAAVQGGAPGLARALWVRGVLGAFTHAVFTATTGAGIGWSRDRCSAWNRTGVVGTALVAAVVQHIVWNVVASRRVTDALCSPLVVGGPCRDSPDATTLLVSIPLVVVAGLAPGALALSLLVRHTRRKNASTVPAPST
jgi:RsiW-degrading membrane proteinase PrsW (M82 family)